MTSGRSISVLIPTYNRAALLPRTLGSVFDQTVPIDEVFLVDDGSDDDTERVVTSLVSEQPAWRDRLHYLRQQNQGKSVALNSALARVRGDWIAFNDSDDTWAPDKLQRQFDALATAPDCGVCFTETSLREFEQRHPKFKSTTQDGVGRVQEPSWLFAATEWPGIYMQTVLVRADVMRRFGEFDPRYRVSQDVDFLFRLGLLTPFCYVDLPLVEIHQDPKRTIGLMTNFPARSWARMHAAESMLHKWLSLVDGSQPALRAAIRHALASARSAAANRYVLAGELEAARSELRRSLKDCPEIRILAKLVMTYTMPALLRRMAARRAPVEFLTVSETPNR